MCTQLNRFVPKNSVKHNFGDFAPTVFVPQNLSVNITEQKKYAFSESSRKRTAVCNMQ